MKRNSILNRQIPQYLGIIFLGISLTIIFWLSKNAIFFGTKAAAGSNPKNIQISNISDTSFTVSYSTDDQVTGTLAYGNAPSFGKVAFDDRDQSSGSPLTYRMHQITIQHLDPETKYFYSIISGTSNFSNTSGVLTVTTAPALKVQAVNNPQLSGKVTFNGGGLPPEAIVYISTETSSLLSALLKPDGSYTLPLKNMRTKDLTSPIDLIPKTPLHMVLMDPTEVSHVTLLAGQASSVPLVLLSKDYDFSLSTQQLAQLQVASPSAQGPGFPTIADNAPAAPQIMTPQQDEKFKDQQPLFKGKSLPNTSVQIIIQSQQEISTTVQSDSNGSWQFRPTIPLSPGKHTITITTLDASGILQKLTQTFTVYAQGSQFTEPSVSPTLSSTPTPTPTLVPTITLQPSQTITPTSSPTSTPSGSTPTPLQPSITPVIPPTISVAVTPSPVITQAPIPKSGSSSLLIGFVGVFVAIGTGAFLFFLL